MIIRKCYKTLSYPKKGNYNRNLSEVVPSIQDMIIFRDCSLNPFASEAPLTARDSPCAFYRLRCYVIRFNGQLYPLTWEEWRDFSKHSRMSTIQWRTPRKKAKNHVTLTWKFPWTSSTTHLPFLSANPKILKAFLKTFPTKWSPLNTQQEKKNEERKVKKEGKRERKIKVKTAVSLLNPKLISKFCFLRMPELRKLIFCIWIRRPRS